jgi:formylmethanofuran dehydrogenase subunit B
MAPYTDTDKQTFLDALAKCGVVGDALKAAGIKTRITVNRWRESDEAFSAAYDEALETAADTLETEARRRAVEGVVSIKWVGKGDDREPVEEVKYSDTLLLALLKANKPDKFAERSKTELSNPDGTFKPTNETEAAVRITALLDAARKRMEGGADSDPLFE